MLAQKLSQQQLQIKEISSDGHCMYRAVEDQLAQRSQVHTMFGVLTDVAVVWIPIWMWWAKVTMTIKWQMTIKVESFVMSSYTESTYSVLFCSSRGQRVWKNCGLALPSTWETTLMTSCLSSPTPTLGTCTQQVTLLSLFWLAETIWPQVRVCQPYRFKMTYSVFRKYLCVCTVLIEVFVLISRWVWEILQWCGAHSSMGRTTGGEWFKFTDTVICSCPTNGLHTKPKHSNYNFGGKLWLKSNFEMSILKEVFWQICLKR